MKRRFTILSVLVVITAVLLFLHIQYAVDYLDKIFYTALGILLIYAVIKLIFEQVIARQIKEPKTRYSMRRISSLIAILTFIAVAIAIWVDNLQALLVSYGVLAAGAAVALQDVFKNLAGGLVIFLTGSYKIGDRIEIQGKIGDVIDIGIFYTTLLETNEWVAGDQATGRLSIIPNNYVLSGVVNNYTRDHPYIWDEISIPLTYDSDWKKALKIIESVVSVETKKNADESDKSISKLTDKYYLPKRATETTVFVVLTDNWINFYIRYITEVRQRRPLKDRLNRELLAELEKEKSIKIASENIDVSIKEIPGKTL
ncbi:MAG: mechanosensitive ion channel [Dehalococcoidales bacterium]|nr:mechanosensitive ion channel [Dehalococcoidales bacterium]